MNRIHTIQYLRAIAALAVVALHAGARVEGALPGGVSALLNLGHAGVDLFFVISGFVMWGGTRHRETAPGRFLLRRAIRIAPPNWIATQCWIAHGAGLGYGWIQITPAHVLQSRGCVPHL
ncbi:MAG: acyltransferase family protein, partial [Thalassovita sp.]|nr:acyltransferase family protein [Thalassovita sp.]